MSQRTIIVGGGAIGLSIAWELARRGDRVTLLERENRVATATSWSAAGILPPANRSLASDPLDRLRGLSHELFPEWIQRLQSTTGIDPGFRRCGGWYLADTAGERASLVGMTHYWQELGIACQSVAPQHASQREPALRIGGDTSAWFLPDECQIRCPDYLRALHHACLDHGVEVISNACVDDVRAKPTAQVHLPDRWLQADRVVLCGGAWTGNIAPTLNLQQSIIPIRGQILLLKTDRPALRGIVNIGHRYVLCRDDGHTIVGSCEEEVGFQLGTTETTLHALHAFACHWVPALREASIAKSWSGLRPMTFDGFPMIGRVPDTDNVFVAAGHFRSGIHLSPATAVTLADLMSEQTPSVSLDAFRIGKQQSSRSLPVTHRPAVLLHD
jgi:glycine oxidase